MKISIITSTYNSQSTIQSCIESVLSQSYPNIEYIIIDGKSTDKTCSIVSFYNKQVHHFISEPDTGIYDAINKGIKWATGDIIGILNSDDYFADSNVVSRIVKAFQENEKEIVFADVVFVDKNNTDKQTRYYSSKSFKTWMFRFGFQPAHPTFYTYRHNFEKYGLYRTDLKIAGDFELLLRFIKINQLSYQYINDTWVKMREGGASTKNFKSKLLLNKEILKALKLNGIYSNTIFVYLKYLIKWWGFVFKRN